MKREPRGILPFGFRFYSPDSLPSGPHPPIGWPIASSGRGMAARGYRRYCRGMNNDELRTLATKRLKARRDFYNYLGIWLGVSIIVIAVWALTTPGSYFWPIWPIGGMGIAAFFIGLDAFGPSRGIITEQAIDEEVARLNRNQPGGSR